MLHSVGLNDPTVAYHHHQHHHHHHSLNHLHHPHPHHQFGPFVPTSSMPSSFNQTENGSQFGPIIPRSINGISSAAAGSAAVAALTAAAAASAGVPPNIKDSRWLTLEVCRQFQRNQCSRDENECKFAHPPTHVDVQSGRVVCCYDSIKGKCQRRDPPCKYLHPPHHLREQLIQNGRNNMIMRNVQFQLFQQQLLAQSGVMPLTSVAPPITVSQGPNQNPNNLANNLNSFLFATPNGLSALSNQSGPPSYSLLNMGFNPYLNALNASLPGPITNLLHSLPNLTGQTLIPNETFSKRSSLPETKTDLSNVYNSHYHNGNNHNNTSNNNNNNNNHHHHHQHTPRALGITKVENQAEHLNINVGTLVLNGNANDNCKLKPHSNGLSTTPDGHPLPPQPQPLAIHQNSNGIRPKNHSHPISNTNRYMTTNLNIPNETSSLHHHQQHGIMVKSVGIRQNPVPTGIQGTTTIPATYFNALNLALAPHPSHLPMSAASFAVASLTAAAAAAAAANGICVSPQTNTAIPLSSNFQLALAETHGYFQTAYPIEIPTYTYQ